MKIKIPESPYKVVVVIDGHNVDLSAPTRERLENMTVADLRRYFTGQVRLHSDIIALMESLGETPTQIEGVRERRQKFLDCLTRLSIGRDVLTLELEAEGADYDQGETRDAV